jgi:hypothetical protein
VQTSCDHKKTTGGMRVDAVCARGGGGSWERARESDA